jgi:hypothetical protein
MTTAITFIFKDLKDRIGQQAVRLMKSSNNREQQLPAESTALTVLRKFNVPFNTCLLDEPWPEGKLGYLIDHHYESEWNNVQIPLTTLATTVNELPIKIVDAIRNGRCKLYYDASREGLVSFFWLKQFYDLAAYYGIENSQIVVITSALNANAVHDEYCNQFNITQKLSIMAMPYWDISVKTAAEFGYHRYTPTEVTKKFICLNRNVRAHRVLLFAYIVTNESLYNTFYYSLNPSLGEHPWMKIGFTEAIKFLSLTNDYTDFTPKLDTLLSYLPLVLDDNVPPTYNSHWSPINKYYDTSLFDVTTETYFNDSAEGNVPLVFMTEKSYKPFNYGTIPILLSGAHIVSTLRSLGYDMFDDLVDHSYDTILDHAQRFHAVHKEIIRLNDTYTLTECNTLKRSLQERFAKNQATLQRFDNVLLNSFSSNTLANWDW